MTWVLSLCWECLQKGSLINRGEFQVAFKSAKINGYTVTSTAKHEDVCAQVAEGGVSYTWLKLKVDLTSNENCDIAIAVFTDEKDPERNRPWCTIM